MTKKEFLGGSGSENSGTPSHSQIFNCSVLEKSFHKSYILSFLLYHSLGPTTLKLLLKYPLDYYYIYQDGTWNGGIKDIIDGVADIGAAYFTASHLRSKVVDFTIPIDEESLTIFLKNPKLSFSWTRFMQPFNNTTWYVLLLMIVICSLSLGCTAYLAKEENIAEFSFEKSLIYSFGAYCAFSSRRFFSFFIF